MNNINNFISDKDFYSFFKENNITFDKAINILIKTNTILSMYVIVQIIGNDSISRHLKWEKETCDSKYIKSLKNKGKGKLFEILHPHLQAAKQSGYIGIHKLINIPIQELDFNIFAIHFEEFVRRKSILKTIINSSTCNVHEEKTNKPKANVEKIDSPIYEKYDYSLSDW